MVVRIRLRPVRRVSRKPGKNRHLALAFAALLWPAVFTAYALAFWRLAADLALTGNFGFSQGLFSHWQTWMALAFVLNVSAVVLNRYGHRGEMSVPSSWTEWMSNFGARK